MELIQRIRIAHMKRKARALMIPMIRHAEGMSCGWTLACYIRPDLSVRYDEGVKLAKKAMALEGA